MNQNVLIIPEGFSLFSADGPGVSSAAFGFGWYTNMRSQRIFTVSKS